MLHFYRSNSQEYLLEKFSEVFVTPQANPLLPDIVIIRNYGIRNWIQSQLVKRLGISANLTFLFPNQFLQKILSSQIQQNKILLDKQAWEWKLLEVLLEIIQEQNEFSRYLQQNNEQEIYQLATHLAEIFQEYALFYPQIFEQKIADNPEYNLQKRIWREIFSQQEWQHIFSLLQPKMQFSKELPQRILLFGISYLPEIYLAIFSELAQQIDIHFFYKNSSEVYLGNLLNQKESVKKEIYFTEQELEDLHYQQGHPLLGFARKESEFQYFLLEYGWDNHLVAEKYFAPDSKNLLGKLQKSMFQLQDPTNTKDWQQAADDSIVVQQCHNPKREIEELHRYILQILDKNPDIQPEDILVKSPNISNYAPFIEQIFSHSEHPLPHTIADYVVELPAWFQTFLQLPNILKENYFKEEIFQLLKCPQILKKFSIEEQELPKLESLLDATNLCWGKDLSQIQETEPLQEENFSWQQAKTKILSACILEQELEIEGQFFETLGNFLHFLEVLFQIIDNKNGLLAPQSLKEWNQSISFMLNNLFSFSISELDASLEIQEALVKPSQFFHSEAKLHFEILFAYLSDFGNQFFLQKREGNYLKNGITFCNIQPMRSIPFAVICFLGLDDISFPRKQENSSLNLLSFLQQQNKLDQKKKLNLSNNKNEDFYIFWETILSAKNFFYASFVGWDKEGKLVLPSLALSLLLQFFCKKLQVNTYEELPFFHKHYLYMFDARYFEKEGKTKNYSQYYYNLAKIEKKPPQQTTILPWEPPEPPKNIAIEELCNFFNSPISYFVSQVLGIHFFEQAQLPSKYNLYSLDSLKNYKLAIQWYKKQASGKQDEQIMQEFLSEQQTAPPQIFQKQWSKRLFFLKNWKKQIDNYIAKKEPKYFSYHKSIGAITILGGGNWFEKEQEFFAFQSTPSQWSEKKKCKLWIQHLFLCTTLADKKPCSYWVGKKNPQEVITYKIKFVPNAEHYLAKIIETYLAGIKEPLAIHSQTFAKKSVKKFEENNVKTTSLDDFAPASSYQAQEQYYWNVCFCEMSFSKQKKAVLKSIQKIQEFQKNILLPIEDFLQQL